MDPNIVWRYTQKKPILAFLATGQHGAAELRVGPDARAVVVHAALTPSPRKKRPEKGKKGWQRMGEGRGSDRTAIGQCVFRRRAASG
eukprot:scaffold9733_cov108-Isochrysis_galbana.AAC.3